MHAKVSVERAPSQLKLGQYFCFLLFSGVLYCSVLVGSDVDSVFSLFVLSRDPDRCVRRA